MPNSCAPQGPVGSPNCRLHADRKKNINPHHFLVGSPRSGTTLLRRMINAHPEIAVTRETHWITRFYEKRIGVTKTGLITPTLLPALFEHRRFDHLGLDPADVERLTDGAGIISYAELVSRMFDLYGKRKGKPLVGDKTPPYVRKVGVLHELFPSARIVHLIRDGREVYLSMRNWRMAHRAAGRRPTWEEDPVSTTALWWEWLVRLGMEAGHQLPTTQYREMHYQELIAEPKAQCEAVCKFLDVSFDESMLRFHEGKTRSDPNLSANQAWLPPTPGLRDWKTQMSPDELEKFEAVAGPLLDELGYERAVARPSQQAMGHAARMRERFDGKPLPRRW